MLASVPESERAESLIMINLDFDELPVERALGVQWNVQEDVFSFRIFSRKKAATRSGILSDVALCTTRSGSLYLSFYLPNACCNSCAKPKWDGMKRFLRICLVYGNVG